MVTIYFDKQLFSHLFKAHDEKFSVLRDKILAHKDEFIFLYSNAHIIDLQQDDTDIKYDEMEFMQSIVDGNHLIYEVPNIFVAKETPRSVFDNTIKSDDFSWLDDFDLSKISKEQSNAINNVIDISLKDLDGQLEFDWLKKRTPIESDRLLVNKETFGAFVKFYLNHFYENSQSYKMIRDNTISMYNPSGIIADSEISFNNKLSLSPLGLSFVDTIKAIFTQMRLDTSDVGMVYYISYMLLDMLGVSKEPRGKVRFHNLQADSCHSFFGSYCDCLVSDDSGMRNKSKELYKLFNLSTQVYSIDEFIEKFDEAINNNRKSAGEYFAEINNDYYSRQIIKTETSPEYTLTYLKALCKYFGYFNYMIERVSNDEKVIILYKNNDTSQLLLMREVEIIVNRLTNVFNDLGANFPLFDPQIEWPQIIEDTWNRTLILNDADICLTKLKKVPMLCLWIKLKQPTA